MKKNKLIKLIISIAICELAGIIGSIFTISEIGRWYVYLKKPFFNPPSFIFGPVWTTLFALMGISLYLVWSKDFSIKNEIGPKKKPWNPLSKKLLSGSWQKANIIIIFGTQLALNILWSVIFFNFHSPLIAFFELLMLWFAIIFTIVNFYRVSKVSAWIMIPYLVWVSFAGILNLSIFLLN